MIYSVIYTVLTQERYSGIVQILRSSKAQFEYEIHALVKAFYPAWDLKILTPESVIKDRKILEIPPVMELEFGENEVHFLIHRDISHTYTWHTDNVSADDYKNTFGRFLYTLLREETGKSLPWGNLTGIRPTKIAMTMLDDGACERDVTAFLRDKHFVSEEKIALSVEIAQREREILSTLHYEDGYSLYIGIPFCPTTCLYCSFTSYPINVWKERVTDYLTALEKEMDAVAQMYRDKILDTVYIGGGTPTSLSAEELDRLLSKLKSTFDFSTVQEFTVEAGRADSITEEKLNVLHRHGVTRISVNPQTMKQETLKLIGRQHTVDQVIDAFHMARKVGFDNINMDIILGLPGETREDVATTIEAIQHLAPDSLTVHSLAVKRASALNKWIEENGITAFNNTEETMRIAEKGARDMGMSPYYLYRQKNMSGNFENVGYSAEDKYGIYNILIMEEKQTIVALGAGSITKKVSHNVAEDGSENTLIERCENVKEVAQYIERIDEMIERKRRLLESD
ncbi:MAG: coproporphyrinogen dehydrogenase HemZ [Lachnospiraceae bacterium]|nr:coproporphyrinogen dehydrogenase HemZ [Lachnospiraceae bacterium]